MIRLHAAGKCGRTLSEYLVGGLIDQELEIAQGSLLHEENESRVWDRPRPGSTGEITGSEAIVWYGYDHGLDERLMWANLRSILEEVPSVRLLVVEPWAFEGVSKSVRYRRDRDKLVVLSEIEDIGAVYPTTEAFTLHEAFLVRAAQVYSVLIGGA